jgi:hypothetical protein
MAGTASVLKSARRLRRGNFASAMRRARRRLVRSSPGGDLGQPGSFGPDGGQLQLAGCGADGGLGGGVGHGAHRVLLVSSWS